MHFDRDSSWILGSWATRRLCLISAIAALGLGGCRPHPSGPSPVDDAAFSECRAAPGSKDGGPSDLNAGLFAAARGAGMVASAAPAARWVEQQTDDGFRLRGALSTGFFALTLLVVKALAAALILALRRRKPRPPWGDELFRRVISELRALRDLGATSEAMGQVVERFSVPLEGVQTRAKELSERCHQLGKRNESTAARGHLVSAEDDLGRLLELVEHLLFQLDAWKSRSELIGDETIEETIAQRIADLNSALEVTP